MTQTSDIRLRQNTNAGAASSNPTLNIGEPGFETDTGLMKIGDGSTTWNNLSYYGKTEATRTIGIRIDTSSSSPTLAYVDINKKVITLPSTFFDDHIIWGRVRRCTIDSDKRITYGTNGRGDGLTLDGSTGNVMTECPAWYWKREFVTPYIYIWYSPFEMSGFDLFPWFNQRGGTAKPYAYWGGDHACLYDNAGTLELISKAGEQPLTGGAGAADSMWKLSFTSGSVEFTTGETLTGATGGATGDVVTFHVSSGTWAGGDAAGDVYLKQRSATAFQAENLDGATAGLNCCTIGAAGASLGLTMAESETYGNNVGTGFGSESYYGWLARQLLMYADFGSLNLQTALGRGIVDKAGGSGFAGEETGIDSINTNVGTTGTGTGTGTDGLTPVAWRSVNNPYGALWQFVTGILAVDAAYQIVNRAGLASATMPTASFAGGEYETSKSAPITADGYMKSVVTDDELLLGNFIASVVAGGSSSTYFCDYWYAHDAAETNIVLGGGHWYGADRAGPGCLRAGHVASYSNRTLGPRLEYIEQD